MRSKCICFILFIIGVSTNVAAQNSSGADEVLTESEKENHLLGGGVAYWLLDNSTGSASDPQTESVVTESDELDAIDYYQLYQTSEAITVPIGSSGNVGILGTDWTIEAVIFADSGNVVTYYDQNLQQPAQMYSPSNNSLTTYYSFNNAQGQPVVYNYQGPLGKNNMSVYPNLVSSGSNSAVTGELYVYDTNGVLLAIRRCKDNNGDGDYADAGECIDQFVNAAPPTQSN